jgi:signal peptidase II
MLYILFCGIAVFTFGFDMLTKYLAVKTNVNVVVIPKLLKFRLSYNTGAAFSFLGEKEWAITLFAVMAITILSIVVAVMVYYIVKKKKPSIWVGVALALIFGGGLGNLVDRLSLKMVRDFIYAFYDTNIFPAIFNIADIALVVGTIMVCIHLLFLDKNAVFSFKKEEKEDEKNVQN